MSEGFEFETAIKDGMSGPAHAEAKALDSLTSALETNEKAVESHAKAHEGAAEAHSLFGKALEFGKDQVKDFTGSLIPEIALGELAAEGIKKLAETVLDLGEELVKTTLEAAEFKENAIEAFETVAEAKDHLFGPSQGEETYDELERIAVAQHIGIAKAIGLAKELALSGVENEGLVEQTVAAQGALQRVGLEVGAEKLRKIVEQSQAVGHFVLPKKLAGLGVSEGEIADRLGLPKGADLKKLKVSVEDGVRAIDDVILNGHVGQLAAKKFDLTDIETDWHNVWKKLVEDVDAGPLTSALRGFVQIFDDGTASGAAFKDEIVHDVNRIIQVLGDVVDHATNFALKFELSWLLVRYALLPVTNEFSRITGTHSMWDLLGQSIKFAADHMIRLADGTAQVVHVLATVGAVGGHVGGVGTGESFVDGLVNSLRSGIPGVHAAGAALGQAAHEGGKQGIDAHSPSRKAYELGQDYGEGYALGGEASHARVAAAMGDLVMPDVHVGAPLAANGNGASKVVHIHEGAIKVEVSGGSASDGVREATVQAAADLLDIINLELGG